MAPLGHRTSDNGHWIQEGLQLRLCFRIPSPPPPFVNRLDSVPEE